MNEIGEKMKILFLTKYFSEGASSRYRYFNYKKYFIENGIEVEYAPLLRKGYVEKYYKGLKNGKLSLLIDIIKRIKYIISHKKLFDHIIIEKELIMFCPYILEKFLLKGCKYSLDFDDNPKYPYTKNSIVKKIYKNKIDNLVKNASFVTVGNKWYYNEFDPKKIIYLPTVVDINKYKEKINYKTKEITIVWIGSKSTVKYLNIIESILIELSKKYLIKLKIIGGEINFKNIKIECIKWSEENESKEIRNSDIGIMPLENTYWEKGKCGFKLIQYMACGLPVVASPAPANNEIISHEKDGYIANNEYEWYEYLEKLILDKELRRKLGNVGRKKIKKKYSYQYFGLKYVNLFKV